MTTREIQLFQPPFVGIGVSFAACKRASRSMMPLHCSYLDLSSFLSGFSLSALYAGLHGYEMQLALGRETRGR